MAITLALKKTSLPETTSQTHDDTQTGLRRWTRDEYLHLKQWDIFGQESVDLRDGLVWHLSEAAPWRWTRADYHRLADAGFFDGERVELIHGGIWKTMSPQKRPHFRTIRAVTEALEEAFGTGYDVQQQGPILFRDESEPEPDVAVVAGSWADYDDHPASADILLIVEVSDSTLRQDRSKKKKDYADEGIPDYWIVNLVNRQLEVYRQPTSEGIYTDSKIYQPGESVAPLNARDKSIAVDDLLPPMR